MLLAAEITVSSVISACVGASVWGRRVALSSALGTWGFFQALTPRPLHPVCQICGVLPFFALDVVLKTTKL